jgi:2-amino-4-hydroxy-6-hydroxymethyldihydropteridine diphosphokinase
MQDVVIGMGSNLGDREDNLLAAVRALEEDPRVTVAAASSVYRSEPMGPALHEFLNAAVRVDTALAPEALLSVLQDIERRAGRPSDRVRWGPRVLDLDVLLASELVRDAAPPVVPHPGLVERDFALRPVLDLLSDPVDPRSGRRLVEVLASLEERTLIGEPAPLPARIDYELLEHTADVGLAVRARSFDELLEHSAMALADAVCERGHLEEAERIDVSVEAPDRESLLVDLMAEVVFVLDARRLLPRRVTGGHRETGAGRVSFAGAFHAGRVPTGQVRMLVKAVTHHDLSVTEEMDGRLRLCCYLDV